MRGTLECWDGRRIALPDMTGWKMEYACGVPCDSFFLTCLWKPEEAGILAEAVRFTADENGERVFTGVVDEIECGWDGGGGRLSVSGRGMAALLLDNEALGCDYQIASFSDILRDHVAPYGIETAELAELPSVPGFSVATGSSEWQVLYEFCRYYGGVTPRFDRMGRLTAAPWKEGERIRLDGSTAVTAFTLRERRYGVLSEILVRERSSGKVQKVRNEPFAGRGGRCRRVLTMPGRSSYQAMRYSGEYQLRRSAEELRRLEVTLPGAFRAWPGDMVELALKQNVCGGIWQVVESASGLDSRGTYTVLTLGERGTLP